MYNFEKKDSKSAEKIIASVQNKKSRKELLEIEARIENTWKEREQEISDRNRLEALRIKRDSSERRAKALQEKLNTHLNGSKKVNNSSNPPSKNTGGGGEGEFVNSGYGLGETTSSSKTKKTEEGDTVNVNKLIQNKSLKNFIEGASVEHRVLEKLMSNHDNHLTNTKNDYSSYNTKGQLDPEYLRKEMTTNSEERSNYQNLLIKNTSQARETPSDKKRSNPLKETPKHHQEDELEKNEVSTEELNQSQHRVQLSEVEEETWRVRKFISF